MQWLADHDTLDPLARAVKLGPAAGSETLSDERQSAVGTLSFKINLIFRQLLLNFTGQPAAGDSWYIGSVVAPGSRHMHNGVAQLVISVAESGIEYSKLLLKQSRNARVR